MRALLGVWPASFGTVRIDGAELTQWSRDSLGRHLGYLPQDVSLCDGTVAENISRFETNPSSDAIIAAAQAAGVHELILTLPNGYETAIGERGETLSAGYRQRIGLARALYGDPFLVILDEPNSNLDMDGELALAKAIRGVCERGGIVIVIAHRPSVLSAVDLVLAVGQRANARIRKTGRGADPNARRSQRTSLHRSASSAADRSLARTRDMPMARNMQAWNNPGASYCRSCCRRFAWWSAWAAGRPPRSWQAP